MRESPNPRQYPGSVYTDEELEPFFREIAKGLCYVQSSIRVGLEPDIVLRTMYADAEIYEHVLCLAMVAGERIRRGEQEVPLERWDGLYDPYLAYHDE